MDPALLVPFGGQPPLAAASRLVTAMTSTQRLRRVWGGYARAMGTAVGGTALARAC